MGYNLYGKLGLFDGGIAHIAPAQLSSGIKALLILYNTDEFVAITRCGDNCAKWITEISKVKPIRVSLNYCMEFDPFPNGIFIENDNTLVTTRME